MLFVQRVQVLIMMCANGFFNQVDADIRQQFRSERETIAKAKASLQQNKHFKELRNVGRHDIMVGWFWELAMSVVDTTLPDRWKYDVESKQEQLQRVNEERATKGKSALRSVKAMPKRTVKKTSVFTDDEVASHIDAIFGHESCYD